MRLPRRRRRLLEHYRQFDDVDETHANRERRARRHRERALALTQVPPLDLSTTEWPELPGHETINATIYTARGRLNGYPDRHAQALRRTLARRHGVDAERIVVGNGAAELLQAAALATCTAGDELLTPWPSYPLYPLMAARAGAKPVAIEPPGRLTDAIGERTRLLVLCNPNDPTGGYLDATRIAMLAAALPERAYLLVDEALIHFQAVEDEDAVLRLTDALPRLVVVRTFSKAYGLSGLRGGYAVGSAAATNLLDAIAPVLGVNSLTQAAMAYALEHGDAAIDQRRRAVATERERLLAGVASLQVEAEPSQANFVWMRAAGMSGGQLASALAREGVRVAPGQPLGAADHVRATIRDANATDRLLSALATATAGAGGTR